MLCILSEEQNSDRAEAISRTIQVSFIYVVFIHDLCASMCACVHVCVFVWFVRMCGEGWYINVNK